MKNPVCRPVAQNVGSWKHKGGTDLQSYLIPRIPTDDACTNLTIPPNCPHGPYHKAAFDMRLTSALATLLCIPVVWSTCYSPIGRVISSIDSVFERELSKCPGNDVCCWSDQECLTDLKLCKDKKWGYRREYCARPGWPETTCSQLCLLVGEGHNDAAILERCPDGKYCCDDAGDGTALSVACCEAGLGFDIDDFGNAVFANDTSVLDFESTTKSSSTRIRTSTSASSSTAITASESTSSAENTASTSEPSEDAVLESTESNSPRIPETAAETGSTSTGAKAGIGAGVAVLTMACGSLAIYLWVRARRKREASRYNNLPFVDRKAEMDAGTPAVRHELPGHLADPPVGPNYR